ncbi:uncharacterized protein [Rutidosis leptorrhynchoides]|uniref:uncharacterized protein n=1 Tax=Rutidosis leptorrhynchoides TaxID=125765 RepID=UPI003A990E6B
MDGRYDMSSNNYQSDRKIEIVSGKGNQIYEFRASKSSNSTTNKSWKGISDAESKRKKRIAKYKVYTIEGRVKASFRNGIRWIKNKCSDFMHGVRASPRLLMLWAN